VPDDGDTAGVPRCDLLVLAEVNPDVVVACADAVSFGQVEQLVDSATLTLGSSGVITAAAAAAQGLRVAVCGIVGDDPVGRLTVELLAATGVDASGVLVRPGLRTGMTVVLTRPGGDRALLTFPGTMNALTSADVDPDRLAGARHVHVSSVFLQTGLQPRLGEVLHTVRAAGGTTSLDPGWDPAQHWQAARDVLAELDYLLPNAAEAVRIAEVDDAVTAAVALHDRGPAVAVKLGADGAVLAGPDGLLRAVANPVDPVDTTGAGDNFDAGFLAARLDGASWSDAVARAVACGTVSVGGQGGTGRLAGRDEAIGLGARIVVESVREHVSVARIGELG
jgi:sugar/nucleoside kinase (ribokinase family)